MKIIDAVKSKRGCPYNIPDCSRYDDFPQFLKDMGYKNGVEIGVYKAEMHNRFKDVGLDMIGVDPYMEDLADNPTSKQPRQDFLYSEAIRKGVNLIRKTSMDAVEDFEDESLDFVYIDGNHRFKYVAEDLVEWHKKVRKGGCVSGHDYTHPKSHKDFFSIQVMFVVDAFVKHYAINNWYVVGAEKGRQKEDGTWEKRDTWRSFFWIKE